MQNNGITVCCCCCWRMQQQQKLHVHSNSGWEKVQNNNMKTPKGLSLSDTLSCLLTLQIILTTTVTNMCHSASDNLFFQTPADAVAASQSWQLCYTQQNLTVTCSRIFLQLNEEYEIQLVKLYWDWRRYLIPSHFLQQHETYRRNYRSTACLSGLCLLLLWKV